jgi:hypothetical protein
VHLVGAINPVVVRNLFFYLLFKPTNAFVGLDNKLYKMHSTYIKIVEIQQARLHKTNFVNPNPSLSTDHSQYLYGSSHFFPAQFIIFILTHFPSNNTFDEIYFFG